MNTNHHAKRATENGRGAPAPKQRAAPARASMTGSRSTAILFAIGVPLLLIVLAAAYYFVFVRR